MVSYILIGPQYIYVFFLAEWYITETEQLLHKVQRESRIGGAWWLRKFESFLAFLTQFSLVILSVYWVTVFWGKQMVREGCKGNWVLMVLEWICEQFHHCCKAWVLVKYQISIIISILSWGSEPVDVGILPNHYNSLVSVFPAYSCVCYWFTGWIFLTLLYIVQRWHCYILHT